jgi:hypothetical protein
MKLINILKEVIKEAGLAPKEREPDGPTPDYHNVPGKVDIKTEPIYKLGHSTFPVREPTSQSQTSQFTDREKLFIRSVLNYFGMLDISNRVANNPSLNEKEINAIRTAVLVYVKRGEGDLKSTAGKQVAKKLGLIP